MLVDDGLIERISGKGTVVLPEGGRQGDKSQNLEYISIIVDEISEYFGMMLSALEMELRKQNIKMLVFCHHMSCATERDAFERASTMPDSLVLLHPVDIETPWLNNHRGAERTIIVASSKNNSIPQIFTDDAAGSRIATQSLLNLGYKKIAHICSDYKAAGMLRKNGYIDALKTADISVDDTLIENGSFSVEGGYSACSKLLQSHPDCRSFFCANDNSAFGAIQALREQGHRFGRDYSIIGFGNLPSGSTIGLSSVNQNIDRQISRLINLLEEFTLTGAINNAKHVIPTELIIRESCIKSHMSTT